MKNYKCSKCGCVNPLPYDEEAYRSAEHWEKQMIKIKKTRLVSNAINAIAEDIHASLRQQIADVEKELIK